MLRKLNIAVITLLLVNSTKNYAQDICVPVFDNKTTVTEQMTFNDYMFNKFQTDFFKYFGTICSQYYDVIKFRINQKHEVIDIRYNATNPDIQNFILETLVSTNGKWRLPLCDEKSLSKEIELPVYFMFTDPCGTVMKMTYYADTIQQSIMPLNLDGLKIQSIREDKITLWPLKLNGPFIQKYHFIKKDNNTL